MKFIYTLSIIMMVFGSVYAQNPPKGKTTTNTNTTTTKDPAAKTILDRVSTKYQSYTSLEVVFSLSITSKVDDLNESMKGNVWLKGQKYRVNTGDVEIICDNVKRWMILKGKQKEVQINFYEPDANNIESPSQLFTIYKNNYNYKLDGKETLDGKSMTRIQLIPANTKESPYTFIYLLVDDQDVIRKARIVGKDGVEYNWQIVTFTPNAKIDEGKFTFNAAQYPGYHIEDLTAE